MLPYRLVKRLGQTPGAEVWEAEHPNGTRVAYKRTRSQVEALHNEARSTARLHHPGIVQVLDVGEVDGWTVVVQELAPGGALEAEAVESWPQARDIFAGVLHALAHAHARGMVHRDLKPSNLLCFPDPPRVRLADFGIARALASAEATVAGTLQTAAPEQLRGDALRPATDLYALGCVAWLLITGAAPFSGEAAAVEFAHQFSPLPPLRPRFAVPPGVEAWLRGLLSKDPLDRPALAADALAGLRRLDPALPEAPSRRRARPAGLELGALREPDLVGRHALKEQLLAAIDGLRQPTRLSLWGPSGVGKTALLHWLGAEAHARGLALTAPMGRGVGQLVAHALHCEGADARLAEERVDEALSQSRHLRLHDRRPLLALLRDDGALPPAELASLLSRLLRHCAGGRPLLWIVEEQPVPDGLVEAIGDLPVLILGTSRLPLAGALEVGPLPDEDATLLLEDLAPLSASEVHRLVARGDGNPQLLVLLAQDPVLPASLREAWRARVLGLCPHPDALALAALLGMRVEREAWAAACARLGLDPPDLEPLFRADLVRPEVDGFRFVQGLAREALLDHPDLHRLRRGLAPELLDRAARLLRTGNPTPAEALLDDLDGVVLQGDERSSWCLLRADLARWKREPTLPWAQAAVEHARSETMQVRALHGLASALAQEGEPRAAQVREEALERAVRHGLHDVATHIVRATATLRVREGRLEEAEALLAGVLARLPPEAHEQRALLELQSSWHALKAGRLAEAADLARRAHPGLLAHGHRLAAYHGLTYRGDALRLLGDLDGAEACFAEAVAITDAMGTQSGAIARLNQGILRLQQDRPSEAAPLLRVAVRWFQAQERATVELGARFWLLCTLEGAEREACLARLQVLLERVPGRDPDLLEGALFAWARWPDRRLGALVDALKS